MSLWKDNEALELARELAELRLKAMHPLKMDPVHTHALSGMQRTPRVYNYQEKMEMRMGWQPNVVPGAFAFIEYRNVGDVVFTWILTNDGGSVVLEDQLALFPSDALITKVRMMGG